MQLNTHGRGSTPVSNNNLTPSESTPWLSTWFVDLSNKGFGKIFQTNNFKGFFQQPIFKKYPTKDF